MGLVILLFPALLWLLVRAATTQKLSTGSYRSSSGAVVGGNSAYNYVPTIMLDGVYKMWWCGQVPGQSYPGDAILYAESPSLNGPFMSPDGSKDFEIVFGGTGTNSFDALHTCDPSIVRVDGTYYMFYGGEQKTGAPTKIGVASSPNGVKWTRLNNDQAIITPADQQNVKGAYGAGQPSVIYLDNLFYLIFTDTTGAAAGSGGEGAGQFAWRSPDPTFQSSVEVFTASGWQAMTTTNSRSFSVADAVSADWQYSDALEVFIIAQDSTLNKTTLTFLDPNDLATHVYAPVNVAGKWSEGPGIVSRPDKHSVVAKSNDCGTIPVDIIRSTTGYPPTTLGHIGINLLSGATCASMPSSQIAAIYEGYGLQTAGLPAAVVVNRLRLQIEEIAVYADLTNNAINVPSSIYNAIPYGASLVKGATVLGATNLPAAFQLDNNDLWAVSCAQIITDNDSTITMVSPQTWMSYPQGPSLYCLSA